MANSDVFTRGETAVPSLAVETNAGVATTPDTSYVVTIEDPDGTEVADGETMTVADTGELSYDYTIAADAVLGIYKVEYVLVHGVRKTIKQDTFVVQALTT